MHSLSDNLEPTVSTVLDRGDSVPAGRPAPGSAPRTASDIMADAARLTGPDAPEGLQEMVRDAAPVYAAILGQPDARTLEPAVDVSTLAYSPSQTPDQAAAEIRRNLDVGMMAGQVDELSRYLSTLDGEGVRQVFAALGSEDVQRLGEQVNRYAFREDTFEGVRFLDAAAPHLAPGQVLDLADGMTAYGAAPRAMAELSRAVFDRESTRGMAQLVLSGHDRLAGNPHLAPVLTGALGRLVETTDFDSVVSVIGEEALGTMLAGSAYEFRYHAQGGGIANDTLFVAARFVADRMESFEFDDRRMPEGLSAEQAQEYRREQTALFRAETVLALGEMASNVNAFDRAGMLHSAERVFLSDPLEIAGQIEQQLDDRRLVGLMDAMISDGMSESIGRMYGALVTDGGRRDSAGVMSDTQAARPWLGETAEQYANARAAGHFEGALSRVLVERADTFERNAALAKNVIQGVAGGVGAFGGPYQGLWTALVSSVVDEASARLSERNRSGEYAVLNEVVAETLAPRVARQGHHDPDRPTPRATGDWITARDAAKADVRASF